MREPDVHRPGRRADQGTPLAHALETFGIARGDVALDLSRALEFHRGAGDKIQVSTASGPDGIVRRIEVESAGDGDRATGRFSRWPIPPTSRSTASSSRRTIGWQDRD